MKIEVKIINDYDEVVAEYYCRNPIVHSPMTITVIFPSGEPVVVDTQANNWVKIE